MAGKAFGKEEEREKKIKTNFYKTEIFKKKIGKSEHVKKRVKFAIVCFWNGGRIKLRRIGFVIEVIQNMTAIQTYLLLNFNSII